MKEYRIQICLKNGQAINLDFDSLEERDDLYAMIISDFVHSNAVDIAYNDMGYYLPIESIAFIIVNYKPITCLNGGDDNGKN